MAGKNDNIEEGEMSKIEEGVATFNTHIENKNNNTSCCSSASTVPITQKVPLYILAQLIGSSLASLTLSLMMDVTPKAYFGTLPVGSNVQSLVAEIIISFLLMFVISGAVTDNRAIGELGGIAVGMTIMLNVFVAGPISGASMNPARSIGPAIVKNVYKGIWVYTAGPIIGAIAGGFVYNLLRPTHKPLSDDLIKTASSNFLKTTS
ncbi:hypothetical protein EZV62_004899 [Acer yangbiense]|uniref:Aquaporin n=1 Tax=Acer yangbiense TaxID=1000413 RepID=A0A5C7IMC5_9ROSI|nr:hypothetical protein EZV62_004899 [Acer yangbiense]